MRVPRILQCASAVFPVLFVLAGADRAVARSGQATTESQNHLRLNQRGTGLDHEIRDPLWGFDPENAIPLPEIEVGPDFDWGDPSLTDREAITIDAATGIEQTMPMRNQRFPLEQWVPGSSFGIGDEEDLYHGVSWDSDLQSIRSESFPWSTHCRLFLTDPDSGLEYVCTATLIDPRHVITAGHCVSKGYGNGWYTDFRVVAAWDGDDDAYGAASWTSATVFSGWHNDGNLNDDMAVIRLDRPVGFLTEWLGNGFHNDDDFYTDNLFNLAGYPAACYSGAPDQLYYGFGSYDSVSQTRLSADVFWTCSTGGLSGSGAYYINPSNSRYVLGVHSTRCYSCDPDSIGHTKMTEGKFSYINVSYIPDGYSDSQRDIVPLDVNVGPRAEYSAGEPLDSLDYLVGNMSEYDPGNDAYTVDVYLSTNNNISTSDTLIQSHTFLWDFGAKTMVRVVASSPVIPADTPSGDYWIGIIITAPGDGNSSNDESDGWDAAPITVEGCQVNTTPFGEGLAGSGGHVPSLYGTGSSCVEGGSVLHIEDGLGGASGVLWIGIGSADATPGWGGHFYIDLSRAWTMLPIRLSGSFGQPGEGTLDRPASEKFGFQGLILYLQALFLDPGAPANVSMSNALEYAVQ